MSAPELKYPLPRYMVDKEPHEPYRIWDTVEHEYTDDEPPNRYVADERAKELNERGPD